MTPQPDVLNFIPPGVLHIADLLCGFIVVCEALNKLHRTAAFARGIR